MIQMNENSVNAKTQIVTIFQSNLTLVFLRQRGSGTTEVTRASGAPSMAGYGYRYRYR